jgi:hypothetical protein
MAKLVIIHWKSGDAKAAAAALRAAGHTVRLASPDGSPGMRPLLLRPPDVFVIDLGRRPSNGVGIGVLVRQRKATRQVPIVFAGGARAAVAGARKVLPDAAYSTWGRVRDVVNTTLRKAPKKPAVPGTMDGYSGTPLARKLGIRAGLDVVLLGAPDDFEQMLGALPEGVRLRRQARGAPDLVLLFTRSRAELQRRLPAARKLVGTKGNMWLTWPKKSSGVETDLSFDVVQKLGLATGMVDFKICAVDATWSGLRFGQKKS